jgi:type II secretory pathway pseudopilin PulG
MTRDRDDAGFSLIELIVSAALGVVVLVLVGTFFISSFAAQSTVTSTADAASRAQLAARQLEQQLRGASAVAVFEGSTSGSQLLVARTATGDGDVDYHCEAWFYDATAEAVFHTSFEGESTWPWGASITNWIDLGSGLTEAINLGGIVGDTLDWLFGGSESDAEWSLVTAGVLPKGTTAGGSTTPVFSAAGNRSATITFEVSAGANNAVLIETTASGRQPFNDEEPTCF